MRNRIEDSKKTHTEWMIIVICSCDQLEMTGTRYQCPRCWYWCIYARSYPMNRFWCSNYYCCWPLGPYVGSRADRPPVITWWLDNCKSFNSVKVMYVYVKCSEELEELLLTAMMRIIERRVINKKWYVSLISKLFFLERQL